MRLWPATLYGTLQRLMDVDLIEESRCRQAPEHDDARRRYYRHTPFGRHVLAPESRRIEELASFAPKGASGPTSWRTSSVSAATSSTRSCSGMKSAPPFNRSRIYAPVRNPDYNESNYRTNVSLPARQEVKAKR